MIGTFTDKKGKNMIEKQYQQNENNCIQQKINQEHDRNLNHNDSSSYEQQIMIKNIDSGSYEVFNIQEVDSVQQIKKNVSAQTKVSLWNSYWEQISKTDIKLLKLVLSKDSQKLIKILNEEPIQLNNFKYIDGWTLLHHAVVSSSQQIVKILIQHKIDINAYSYDMKRTPLHEAVLLNKYQIIQIMIDYEVDLNIQDIDGNTPIHYAAQLSYLKVFSLLLTKHKYIDFTLKNNHQMTILDCIRDQRMYNILQSNYTDVISQNQYLKDHLQNRRFIKLGDQFVIKRYSKSDLIQKFLSYKELHDNIEEKQLIQTQQFKRSTQSDSSNGSKKKQNLIGKKPSHWIKKKGEMIASQSICLMKESMLEQLYKQDKTHESLENYDILRCIGSGGFAQVFLARKKKSSQLLAIKRIFKGKIIQSNLKRYVYAERNIMIKCYHPFIVQSFSMFQDQAYLYIAMQYCECGDLEKMISKQTKIQQESAKIYAAQVGLALQQLHQKNILFRDLKSSNILITHDGYLKLSDFGLAKQSLISFSFLGSVQYLAPQMLVDNEMKEHTKSIDWYLFGVLIYEMVTGRPPFYGLSHPLLFKKIKQETPIMPNYLSEQCKGIILKLLEKKPQKRLGSKQDFVQIKKQKWFKNVDFGKVLRKQYKVKKIEEVLKQSDLRRKIPIDSYQPSQKYEYFKQWNYVRKDE